MDKNYYIFIMLVFGLFKFAKTIVKLINTSAYYLSSGIIYLVISLFLAYICYIVKDKYVRFASALLIIANVTEYSANVWHSSRYLLLYVELIIIASAVGLLLKYSKTCSNPLLLKLGGWYKSIIILMAIITSVVIFWWFAR